MSIIPGASVLGFGFNILGPYSTRSMTARVFSVQAAGSSPWQYPPTSVTYDVPGNVSVNDVTQTRGQAYVFKSKDEFSAHFAGSASVGFSAGAFSGEFASAYSNAHDESRSCFYCMYEALYDAWSVNMKQEDRSALDDDFVNDLMNLPQSFDPTVSGRFFDFFQTWGTHYISAAVVGGALRYYWRSIAANIRTNRRQART